MPRNPEMRASDGDRDRVAESLREHCAVGRITIEELEDRLEAVYAARTFGELDRVTADLPQDDQYELPVPARQRAGTPPAERRPGGPPATPNPAVLVWGTWAAVSGICLTIWLIALIAGGTAFPWWLWVAGPWGLVLLIRTINRR